MAQRDIISKLADRGEEVLSKFAETPGAHRVLELLNSTRERLDDIQKRVIGLESLERRIDELEQRLARVEGSTSTASTPAATTATAKATPPKKAAPKKPPASSD
jgi:cell division septum initiation protein DivIVA